MKPKSIAMIVVVIAPIAALIQCTQFSNYKIRKDYTMNLSVRNDAGVVFFQGGLDTTCIREDGYAFGGDSTSSYYLYPTFHKIKLDYNKDAYVKSLNNCIPKAGESDGVELYVVDNEEPGGIVIGYIPGTNIKSGINARASINVKAESRSKYHIVSSTKNEAENFLSHYKCYKAEQYLVPMHLRHKLEGLKDFAEVSPWRISYDVFRNSEWGEIREATKLNREIFPVEFSVHGMSQITRVETQLSGTVYCKIYDYNNERLNDINTSYITINGKMSKGAPLINKPLRTQGNYIAYGNSLVFEVGYRQIN